MSTCGCSTDPPTLYCTIQILCSFSFHISRTTNSSITYSSIPNCRYGLIRWLQAPDVGGVFTFSEESRAVPVETKVLEYRLPGARAKNDFMFDKGLDSQVTKVVRKYSQGKSTMVSEPVSQ